MADKWLSVIVELLGGRGEELWPYPGRIFAVGPSHTFADLANAINEGFARWDRSHLSMFNLTDGRVITDEQTGNEMTASIGGPIQSSLDIETTKVSGVVRPGEEFQFTFDLGDNWTHRCLVEEQKINPRDVVGITPRRPMAYWGWGAIPDQYGRRWADDDGEGRTPRRPSQPHPMRLHTWPGRSQVPELDLRQLRGAIVRADGEGFLAAVTGREIDDALQLIGAGIPMALEQNRDAASAVALSIVNRLTMRDETGDDVLAEDLLALLRHEPLPGRVAPVDLDMLSGVLAGDFNAPNGGYVDLQTGQVYDASVTDPMEVGEDAAIDVESEPERWLSFDATGSRDAWRDMADFARRQPDANLREGLERAIEGKGAFRRFGDIVHEENLAERWRIYSDDRSLGRARAFLATKGLRVG